jgi:16S rRNA (guanine527-N7)-methyltransferase
MDNIEFWTVCSSNGLVFSPDQMRAFERFHDEILYYNKHVNLISRKDEENVYERHILHSLSILKYFEPPSKARCIDVGTGGGFPGIPLKIARPEIRMTLTDSIAKKIKITSIMAAHTALKGLSARTVRVEALEQEKDYFRQMDCVFARAVAPLEELVGWTRNLLKPGGRLIALKGGDLSEEIETAKAKFPGLRVEEHQIRLIGADWFEREEKKVLLCS